MNDIVYSNVRELNKMLMAIEPELKKQFVKDLKMVANPVKDEIVRGIPEQAPLSGFERSGRMSWNGSTNKKGRNVRARNVTIRYKASGSKFSKTTPLLKVVANSPAVSMIDMARNGRTAAGAAMIRNLVGRTIQSHASRMVWPSGEKALPKAISEAQKVMDKAASIVSRKLK